MIKRIDQQIRVNKLMVDAYLKANVSNRRLRAYMFSYLDIITTVSSIMLVRAATQECLDKNRSCRITSKTRIWDCTGSFGEVSSEECPIFPEKVEERCLWQPIRSVRSFMDLIKKAPNGAFFYKFCSGFFLRIWDRERCSS